MMNVSSFSPPSGEEKKKDVIQPDFQEDFMSISKKEKKKITTICCYQQLKILYLITMEDVLFHNHL